MSSVTKYFIALSLVTSALFMRAAEVDANIATVEDLNTEAAARITELFNALFEQIDLKKAELDEAALKTTELEAKKSQSSHTFIKPTGTNVRDQLNSLEQMARVTQREYFAELKKLQDEFNAKKAPLEQAYLVKMEKIYAEIQKLGK